MTSRMNTRFDTEARIAVTQATDLARELGAEEVGPGHLLLGLLANPRGSAYAALSDHGVTFDAAREIVLAHQEQRETTEPTDAFEDVPDAAYDEDREALRAIGIDLDQVRAAVRDDLGQDLAQGWGSRPERGGRSRRRGPHRRHEHHDHDDHHDHEHRGRGRRGPRSRRDGDLRWSRSLRALLRDVRRAVLRDLAEDDGGSGRGVPGMTGARMLVALIRSDDPAVEAVLATATGLDALRAQAEAVVAATTG